MSNKTKFKATHPRRGSSLLILAALITLASTSSHARDFDRSDSYQQTNLVSDLPGVALLQDTNLVNAWGLSFSSTSPFWISDNGSGLSTLYAVTNEPAVRHT